MISFQHIFLSALLFLSCQTGKLQVIADLPSGMTEISAAEYTSGSDLLWVIEDGGHGTSIYGLDGNGDILKEIKLTNAKNIDWEDLTIDNNGNIYVGDFGNNSRRRQTFSFYKVTDFLNAKSEVSAARIDFSLPDGMKSKDFEAFFIFENNFYIFSKESKDMVLLKVPNKVGKHQAELLGIFNLKGKNNRITSADISADGKSVILLNHDKVWLLSNFETDNFLDGKRKSVLFDHHSKKEGVCFKNDSSVFLTEESNGKLGANMYFFEL